jgi:predicted nucleic acid-binding protein
MQYVIDACVVAKWFIPEPHKANAERILRNFVEDKVKLIAPDFLVAEVGNLLWKRSTLQGELSERKAAEAMEALLALDIDLRPAAPVARSALRLAAQEKHSVYDMIYVALAQQEACELITADEKMLAKLRVRYPLLRELGDF